MAKAMTATRELRGPGVEGQDQTVMATRWGGTMNMPFLLAKNILFWGSVSLSLYGLYALVAAF